MRRLLGLTAVASLVVVVGCGPSIEAAPLEEYGEGGTYCGPVAAEGGVLSFAGGYTQNTSEVAAEVTKVELLDAVGMELVGSKVQYVPEEGPSDTVGVLYGWPPDFSDFDPAMAVEFERADDLEGAVIPPGPDTTAAFAIGIRAERGAHGGPLRLTYRAGGREWTWTGVILFRTAKSKACGEDGD